MNLQGFSLLWPQGAGRRRGDPGLPAQAFADLDLEEVVRAIAGRDRRRDALVRAVLSDLATDADTIAYRQEVVEDLLERPRLREALSGLLPALAESARPQPPASRREEEEDWGVLELARRVSDLALYVRVVTQLRDALAASAPRSRGLAGLLAALEAEMEEPSFRALAAELPGLRERLQQGESITLAINLKPTWEPESVTILSIGPRRAGTSLLSRVLGAGPSERGLTPLRRADAAHLFHGEHQLFHDLRTLLEAAAAPVLAAMEKYHGVNAAKLAHLEGELAFYLGAASLVARLRALGLPFCRAEVAPPEERASEIQSAWSLPLALRLLADGRPGRRRLVPSDVRFGAGPEEGCRIWILTGPNRGGKTTFLRAVGVGHVLFAAGLPVPAVRARISPLDRVVTHFVTQEHGTPGEGRLDEEAEQLARIFAEATPQSLILLNEVLAGSTSQIEALALATDAVRGLRLLGARCIYATHLHDLAATVDRINASVPEGDSPVGSLVAGVAEDGDPVPEPFWFARPGAGGEDGAPTEGAAGEDDPAARGEGEPQPTFHVVPGPPRGQSFASAIARQHGISYPQLREKLRARGIVRGPA
jgi:DNA mismatch repair protein MutS